MSMTTITATVTIDIFTKAQIEAYLLENKIAQTDIDVDLDDLGDEEVLEELGDRGYNIDAADTDVYHDEFDTSEIEQLGINIYDWQRLKGLLLEKVKAVGVLQAESILQ